MTMTAAVSRIGAFHALAIAGLVSWMPLATAVAQKPPKIGYLHESAAGGTGERAFLAGMRDLGYILGQNFTFIVRAAGGQSELLPALAVELVAAGVDVIVTGSGTPAALAAKSATTRVPIVMVNVQSPVEDGLIQSLARPGGNATGFMSFGEELAGKRLELAKEAMPGLKRIGVMWNAANAANTTQRRLTEDAARALGIELDLFPIPYPEGVIEAFAKAAKNGATAMLVLSDVVSARYAPQIAAAALEYRLAGIHYNRRYLESGGGTLLSYGPNFFIFSRRAATFVDRILKGAQPADMPVEQPTKFILAINLKGARALGLAIPESLLARADEVIE